MLLTWGFNHWVSSAVRCYLLCDDDVLLELEISGLGWGRMRRKMVGEEYLARYLVVRLSCIFVYRLVSYVKKGGKCRYYYGGSYYCRRVGIFSNGCKDRGNSCKQIFPRYRFINWILGSSLGQFVFIFRVNFHIFRVHYTFSYVLQPKNSLIWARFRTMKKRGIESCITRSMVCNMGEKAFLRSFLPLCGCSTRLSRLARKRIINK